MNTPETAIREIESAMSAVESLPAHRHLTDAVVLLGKARDKVCDFSNGVPEAERRAIYKFCWGMRRSVDLEGVFVATPEEVAERVGKEIYFGEVEGKHSEVYGVLKPGDVKLIIDDPDIVKVFEDNDLETGFNPLRYNWRVVGGGPRDWVEV